MLIFFFNVLLVWAIDTTSATVAEERSQLDNWKVLETLLVTDIRPFSYLTTGDNENEQVDEMVAPTCVNLTDNFCHQLWDTAHDGNWDRGNSQFLLGESKKSSITMVAFLNLQALLQAEGRLPPLLQEKLRPVFAKIRSHLEEETDSSSWYRKLTDLTKQIDYAVEDTAKEITYQQYPALAKKELSTFTVYEHSIMTQNGQDLANAIVKAKYEFSPNWQRVLKLAQDAKRYLIAQVENLDLPASYRQKMVQRLSAVEIVLPYEDPRILTNQIERCSTTLINAYYHPPYNRFTVCAGMFNGIQSDGALYATIAHELAHAIDPNSMAKEWAKDHPVIQIAEQFRRSTGKTFSCEQWENLKNTLLIMPAQIKPLSLPTANLQSCLVDKSDLIPWDNKNIYQAIDYLVRNNFRAWARSLDFTRLSTFSVQRKGEKIYNEFYLRPDIMKLKDDGYYPVEILTNSPLGGIFVQALLCQPNGNQFFLPQKMPTNLVQRSFAAALEETKNVYKSIMATELSFCGDECGTLVGFNMALQSHEKFADFLAVRSMSAFVAAHQQLATRRQIVEEMNADLCIPPGIASDSPSLAAIEAGYTNEAHGDNRQRRLSIFSPELIQLARCLPTAEVTQTTQRCVDHK